MRTRHAPDVVSTVYDDVLTVIAEYADNTRQTRLVLLQHAILKR